MEKVVYDQGITADSRLFLFTPSEIARQYYYYPVWCGHYFCNSGYFIKRQFYRPFLLAYIRKGKMHVEYEGKSLDAGPGDLLLLDCRKKHYYHAYDGLEFVFLHFEGADSEKLCQRILQLHGFLIRSTSNITVGNRLYELVGLYEQDHITDPVDSSTYIYQLLMTLIRPVLSKKEGPGPIDQAILYINNHVNFAINLTELADLVHLAPSYFSRLFKEETGLSPREYVIRVRIAHAKFLLLNTSDSIEEIAARVGYQNSSTLIRQFHKIEGVSPLTYRQENR